MHHIVQLRPRCAAETTTLLAACFLFRLAYACEGVETSSSAVEQRLRKIVGDDSAEIMDAFEGFLKRKAPGGAEEAPLEADDVRDTLALKLALAFDALIEAQPAEARIVHQRSLHANYHPQNVPLCRLMFHRATAKAMRLLLGDEHATATNTPTPAIATRAKSDSRSFFMGAGCSKGRATAHSCIILNHS